MQHAKEMSARESDDPSAASDEEQCSVTARPAAIRAARRRAICEPFTECLSGIATGSTNVELEGEKLFGAIFRLVRSFSIALVDDIVAWRQALGAIGQPIVGCVGSRRHAAKRPPRGRSVAVVRPCRADCQKFVPNCPQTPLSDARSA